VFSPFSLYVHFVQLEELKCQDMYGRSTSSSNSY